MRKRYGIWFRFNGLTCMETGSWLLSAPAFVHPAWRGTALTAVGRSGDVFATDEAEEPYEMKLKIRTHISNQGVVGEWLSGAGLLSFSWRPDRACPARIEKSYQWAVVVPGRDPIIEADVLMTCQPWHYMQPEATALTIAQSGTEFYNPGSKAALPTVTVRGSGSFIVTIGDQSIYMQNISGGIVLNSELGDAYNLAVTELLNNKVTGDLWEIAPGRNTISWELEQGASISKIEILPKWRFR